MRATNLASTACFARDMDARRKQRGVPDPSPAVDEGDEARGMRNARRPWSRR